MAEGAKSERGRERWSEALKNRKFLYANSKKKKVKERTRKGKWKEMKKDI